MPHDLCAPGEIDRDLRHHQPPCAPAGLHPPHAGCGADETDERRGHRHQHRPGRSGGRRRSGPGGTRGQAGGGRPGRRRAGAPSRRRSAAHGAQHHRDPPHRRGDGGHRRCDYAHAGSGYPGLCGGQGAGACGEPGVSGGRVGAIFTKNICGKTKKTLFAFDTGLYYNGGRTDWTWKERYRWTTTI